jgi:hypothetical protein
MASPIFSDDPEAINLLTDKLSKLEHHRYKCKKVNVAVRKKDNEALGRLGFNDAQIGKLYSPDFAGRIGIPDYILTNLGSEIRRIKQRIEKLQRCAA